MALQIGPDQPHPTHWFNSEGYQMRLQLFVLVRDDRGRVACVREKERAGVWNLPGETVKPNVDVNEAASWVSEMWFVDDLKPRIADVLTFPAEGPDAEDNKWYIVLLYEAKAPDPSADDGGLEKPDDTEEIRMFPLDEPPGEWGMDHGAVWAHLKELWG